MIRLLSGTPGSGKTYQAVVEMVRRLGHGERFITNIPLTLPESYDWCECYIWQNEQFTIKNFEDFAQQHHHKNEDGDIDKLHQTIVVIDEAHLILGSNYIDGKQEQKALEQYFSQHRKDGYDFIFITQHIKRLDPCIRDLVESETMYFNLEFFPIQSTILELVIVILKLFKVPIFCGITQVVHMRNRVLRRKKFFFFRKKYGKMYNTFKKYNTKPNEPTQKKEKRKVSTVTDPLHEVGVSGPQPSAREAVTPQVAEDELSLAVRLAFTAWGAKVESTSKEDDAR